MKDYLATYLDQTSAQLSPAPPGVILENAYPKQLTKPTQSLTERRKQDSVSFVSPLPRTYPENKRERQPIKHKSKVWRRAPYWQACAEATRLPSGAFDLESADLLFAALALREGHTPDETCDMLRRCTPRASMHPDYCAEVISSVSGDPASYITAELVAKYAAAHPFAWELGLNERES